MDDLGKTCVIRPTEPGDAPLLFQWLSDPKILRWFPMFDAREIEDAVNIWIGYSRIGAGLTAEIQGKACGLANLYIQPYRKLSHTCLLSIIVKEEMRGKGIGRRLIEGLIQLAREKFHIEVLHLEVYEENPAIYLYKKMGFEEFGCHSRFIKEEGKYLGKIFMQKTL